MFFLTMKHPFRCILPFIFLFSFVSIALSSNPLVINIPKETFKGDNKNWAIDQDERGYIYVANNSGLLQFDGVSWKSFTLPQSTIVRSLYVKDNRQIYTGSFEDFGVWTRSCDGSLSYQSLLSETDRKEQHNNDFWRILEFDNKIYHCCPIKIAKRSLKYLKFSSLQRFFESTDLNL